MSRRTHARLQFDALTIEGGLLPAEWLGRVAALDAPAQSPADYGVPKGLQLRDEIGRYWRIAEALWAEFASGRAQPGHDAAGAARAFVRQLLTEVLGLGELAPGGEVEAGGRRFPVTYQALGGRVPVFVGAPGERLDDPVMRHGDGIRRRSAWGALQEYLNAAEDALWGLASNGLLIRLGRDNASLTRPAWLEADLERIFTDGLFADFSALWLVLHASRFGRADQPADAAPLEAWRAAGREEGSRARDQLRKGVEAALRELGQGFVAHPQNTALRDALASGALTPGEYFNELLRLVYRMIFLLTVEEREILHAEDADAATRALYREGYGMRRLRDRAVRSTLHDRHGDLWASLLPVFAGLGRAGGEPALGLPGLGGLFAPEQCPTLDACALNNRSLLISVFRLAWLREPGALSRVNWKDMGPEELGSVYESLLELVPRVSTDAREFGFAGAAESAGNTRKLTGSYYTPDALVQQLLDTALEPVVAQRLAAHPENLADALLSISVIDPACGSGHFLLAAARRLAGHLARARAGGTPGAAEYRHALREVVTHCIYGVDRNPMALELARMALWLEAFSPDRALGFLDHHLVCGDALLGLMDLSAVRGGIPDEAFKPLTGDDKEVAKALAKRNRDHRKTLTKADDGQYAIKLNTGALGEAFDALDALEDPDVDAYEAKRRRFLELHSAAEDSPAALAANCFLAAFLSPKGDKEDLDRVPTSRELLFLLEGSGRVSVDVAAHARKVCREARVLHWPLAFPQVFEDGGFDVVLGNPPWETMSPDRREFFAKYVPEISELSPENQEGRISELLEQSEIAADWNTYSRNLYVHVLFMKEGGRYSRYAAGNLGKGDFNVYRQFVEFALDASRLGGFAAQIVPENFYNGANAAAIRASIFDSTRLQRLLGFENHRGYWFPGIDTRMKFALYAAQNGGNTAEFDAAFAIRNTAQLQRALETPLRLTVAAIKEFSPDAQAVMEFSNQFEVDICTKMYTEYPLFGDESIANQPLRHYMAEVHMGNDSRLFVAAPEGLPVYQGSMVSHFDHRAKAYVSGHGRSTLWRELSFGSSEKAIVPQWFIPEERIPNKCADRVRTYRIGFCDVGNATNQRALMASLIPPGVICGHKVPTINLKDGSAADLMLWLAVANSLVMDFLVRMKIALTMSTTLLDSLPFPRSIRTCKLGTQIAALAARLTLTGEEMYDFRVRLESEGELASHDLTPSEDPHERELIEAELNARVARQLYGLTRIEMAYLLEPSDVLGAETEVETFRSLRDQEMRAYGEYRTRRLVLEAWDRMFGD